VTSQYPNAQLRRQFVVGHPKILLNGDPAMPKFEDMNGDVKAKVLPLMHLFVPVLPYRSCSKLLFPLCRTCCETQNQGVCDHDDPEDRALTGTWPAPEFKMAVLQRDYKVIDIYEVYQYPEMAVFDPEKGVDGLFSGYVREMMALKQHASGWPSGVTTQVEKDQYIQNVLIKDGITLDPSKMERNEGQRTLSKLMLNSFCMYTFKKWIHFYRL